MPRTLPEPTPTVLVDEYFSSGDARFLEAVRSVRNGKYLAGLADRWKNDPRPWARNQVFSYLQLPMDRFGHNVVVKRLFKSAEANRDDELMAAFLVAFDRLVRRTLVTSRRYDFTTGAVETRQRLKVTDEALLPPKKERKARNPLTGEIMTVRPPQPEKGVLFSTHTRAYLRRRAWRYFRTMGYSRPADYLPAVTRALLQYEDADLASGSNILDNWGLLNALFRGSEVLNFAPPHATIREGRSLSEVTPAPKFPELWKKPAAAATLFSLLTDAQARLVRVWAADMLREHHAGALESLSADQLVALLESEWPDVQSFAAERLPTIRGLESLPVAQWLRLLETENLNALDLIVAAIRKHVRSSRLSTAECVSLANARTAPVARLGLEWLRERDFSTPGSREPLPALSEAQCAAAAYEVAQWAISVVGKADVYHADAVLRFFDSLNREVRRAACDWADGEGSPGHADSELWSRLVETPYEEVRLWVTRRLAARAAAPKAAADALLPVWSAVLLGVHRGGREKLLSIRTLAEALARRPERSGEILPVLRVAVRSIRGPERRAGLAAIAMVVAASPELSAAVQQAIPELGLQVPEECLPCN